MDLHRIRDSDVHASQQAAAKGRVSAAGEHQPETENRQEKRRSIKKGHFIKALFSSFEQKRGVASFDLLRSF